MKTPVTLGVSGLAAKDLRVRPESDIKAIIIHTSGNGIWRSRIGKNFKFKSWGGGEIERSDATGALLDVYVNRYSCYGHYLVAKDEIIQLASHARVTQHVGGHKRKGPPRESLLMFPAGKAKDVFPGIWSEGSINNVSIGVELMPDAMITNPLPESTVQSVKRLCEYLVSVTSPDVVITTHRCIHPAARTADKGHGYDLTDTHVTQVAKALSDIGGNKIFYNSKGVYL